MKDNRMKETMAAIFVEEEEPEREPNTIQPNWEPGTEPPKRRRRSLIDRDVIPETLPKQKRHRRKKDPALCKTHSMTVLMTENLFQRFKAVAEQQELSMNGIATRLIKKYVMTHDVDLTDLDADI